MSKTLKTNHVHPAGGQGNVEHEFLSFLRLEILKHHNQSDLVVSTFPQNSLYLKLRTETGHQFKGKFLLSGGNVRLCSVEEFAEWKTLLMSSHQIVWNNQFWEHFQTLSPVTPGQHSQHKAAIGCCKTM